jgi:hypothetical protein
MIYYSKSKKGFFHEERHGKNIPSDSVLISEEVYETLFKEQSEGKEIVPDEKGYPIAVVPPVIPPAWEQIRSKRNALLKDSDWVGLTDAVVKNKEAWLTYRQALRDLPSTFKTPEEVIWPTKPE